MIKNFLEVLKEMLERAFGTEYYDFLQRRTQENDYNDIFSMTDLAQRYPDFKTKVIALAKNKLKIQTEGLDQNYKETVTKKFMNFDQGLKLVKGLIDGIVRSSFGNTDITNRVLSTFTSTVCTQGVLWFKDYHDSEKYIELYEVEEVKNSDAFKLFYLEMYVKARRIESFLHNESKTELKAKYKVIEFANLQALLEWALT